MSQHSPAQIIAIDMDGTLLRSDGRVSPRTLAALRAAEAANIEVVIATGRRHCYAMKVLRDLDLNPRSVLISSNGTVIRTIGSQLLQRTEMPLETARWICNHVAEFRDTLVITFDKVDETTGEDSTGALVVEQLEALHASVAGWMRANQPYITHVPSFEDALHGESPIQMMICGTLDRMARAEAVLLQHEGVSAPGLTSHQNIPTAGLASDEDIPAPGLRRHERRHGREVALHRTQYPARDLSILDILPAGCSKASALQWLAHRRGIPRDRITAIGDNWNDVSMLEFAGRPCLMANAPNDLLEAALHRNWQLLPSHDEDGVAQAIEAALHPEPTPTL